jgi:ubiquinone/menaquinone biosynthesis C-methylase UbiE
MIEEEAVGMTPAIRHQWALKKLSIDSSDRVLEIGCGSGGMAAMICSCLINGTMTAIDRSKKMIFAAEKHNELYVTEGKVRFIQASLLEADFGASRFNKIFAINVNLFWLKANQELEMIKRLLEPDGNLYLFYQPPAAGKVKVIVDSTSQNLQKADFEIQSIVMGEQQPVPVVCMMSTNRNRD